MNYSFPQKVSVEKKSLIREVAEKGRSIPHFLSFALGSPASECVPTGYLQSAADKVFHESPEAVFNYGPLAGYEPLRQWIRSRMILKKHAPSDNYTVLMLTGSGKGIALASRTLSGEGDEVFCDLYSYPNAVNGMQFAGAVPVGIPIDEKGMIPEALEEAAKKGKGKWIYLIPNFHNPLGMTMPEDRRKELYSIAVRYGLIIYEDDPYGEVRFAGEDIPSFISMDTEGIVVYAGSFSKTLSAGIRVGYLYGSDTLIRKFTAVKNADGQDPIYNQMIVYNTLTSLDYESHLDSIRRVYRKKCSLMVETLRKECASSCRITEPEGGLFVWVDVPEKTDVDAMSDAAIQAGIGVVKSAAFQTMPGQPGHGFRLNFSAPSEDDIVRGAQLFGQITRQFC